MTTPTQSTTVDQSTTRQPGKLVPRNKGYQEFLIASDVTLWRWTREGKLSPPDAVINGRNYSFIETIEADIARLASPPTH